MTKIIVFKLKSKQQIVNWLKDYAQNAKVNGFVVGISGLTQQ
jgi:NAD+ synthase